MGEQNSWWLSRDMERQTTVHGRYIIMTTDSAPSIHFSTGGKERNARTKKRSVDFLVQSYKIKLIKSSIGSRKTNGAEDCAIDSRHAETLVIKTFSICQFHQAQCRAALRGASHQTSDR